MIRPAVPLLMVLLAAAALHADDGATTPTPTPKRQWVRLWPAETDGPATVRGRPSTGPGSVDWFQFGAGRTKTFEFTPGRPVLIRASGDSCGGCCLGHVGFKLTEAADKPGAPHLEFAGPGWSGQAPAGEPTYRLIYFTPTATRYTITCVGGGFYIQVYQSAPATLTDPPTDEDRRHVAELIKQLGHDEWTKREAAQSALTDLGPRIAPLLEQAAKTDDVEIGLRLGKVLAKFKAQQKHVADDEMAARVESLVDRLADYIEARSFDCASEPVRGLSAPGPMAAAALKRHATHDSPHVRAAAVHALGKLKPADAYTTLASALANDKSETVRIEAAGALAGYGIDEARDALRKASEDDRSEKVRNRAAESLTAAH